uniref:Uncharacterized protein n=1 Tax=Terrapene triunguis TaxID=2587831 RepID=A0A674HU48_9SAUR
SLHRKDHFILSASSTHLSNSDTHVQQSLTCDSPTLPPLGFSLFPHSEMQLQDQQLLEKLLQLHTSMQELKVECAYWESSDPSRETIRARARSSSEDMGAPVPTGGSTPSLKGETSRRNSIP